jgi:hypothetical protein
VITIAGTVMVSRPLPAGHSPGEAPEAVSVLAASIASRSEQAPSSATMSEFVSTGIIAACAGQASVTDPSALNPRLKVGAKNSLSLNDLDFNIIYSHHE